MIANYDEDTDLQCVLTNNKLGMFSQSGNSNQMAEAILQMYKDPLLCREYGRNAREYVLKNVSREVSVKEYVRIIKEVINL